LLVEIEWDVLSRTIADCRARLPFEACGVLLGEHKSDTLRIRTCVPLTNAADRPETSFRFDEREWLRILYEDDLRKRAGHRLLGIYHSHPAAGAVPSADDRAAVWSGLPTYWIVSLADADSPQIAAFRPHRPPGAAHMPCELLPLAYSIVG
jgi:proteasome lid subunit RPN8/RPN11